MASLILSEIPTDAEKPPQFQVQNRETVQHADPAEVPDPHTWPVPGAGDEPLMRQLRWYLETYLSYPFDPYTKRAEQIEAALKTWGREAFNALFNNRDAGTWLSTEAGAEFDLTITFDQPQYLAWPWEALHDPKTGYFGHRARIQRRLSKDAPDPAELPDDLPKDCIHILLITARPYENDVDFRSISRPLVDLIRDEKLPATVEVLRPPTFSALRKHLDENKGRYHILHFDGHGGYGIKMPDAPATENLVYLKGAEGRLLFEKKNGKADEIAAEKLATLLAGCGIPFVVLNACRSAALDQYAHEGSAFASVAGGLVKAGFRGVLAMSHNLTVSGASVFLPAFYRELFASGNLLEATRAGRLKMVENARRSAWNPEVELKDWLLPVAYQQRDDFDLSFAADARPPEPVFPMPEDAKHAKVENFVGRDAAIQALERQWRKKAPAILVHGLGGIGKTTLALHFLQWLRDTGGLTIPPFWFSFDDIRSAAHVFNQIGRAFGGAQFDGDQPEQFAQLIGDLRDNPFVIVWDNFESARGFSAENTGGLLPDEDAVRLKDFLAAIRGGKTRVLITSRSDEDWLPKKNCHRLRLGGLRGEELWEYAAGIVEELDLTIDRNDRQTRVLLEEKLEGHPILVRAVLSRLEEGNIGALTQKIEAGLGEIVLKAAGEMDSAHQRLLGALDVVGDGFSEEEREYLIPIALHERFIDLDYVHQMGENTGQIESYDKFRMETVFSRLESAGLLSELGQNVFSIHPLLTSFFRIRSETVKHVGPLETAWQRAFVTVMGRLADHVAPKKLHEQRGVSGLHHGNFHRAMTLANEMEMEESYLALIQSLAQWALNTRDFTEAGRLYESMANHSHLAGNQESEAASYHQLGRVAEEQRDFKRAEDWYLKSLAITEKQGNEHIAACSYHQLGLIAQEQRDLKRAEDWYLKSLAIEERLGDEHGAAISYQQLGRIAEEQRDFKRAEDWFLKSLAIKKKQGNEHGAAISYHQLGIIAQEQRDFKRAEDWYLKSLAIDEKQGNEHGAAITYGQLGRIAEEQRNFERAEDWYLKSLAIKEKQGNEHGAANTYHQLGMIAQQQRDFNRAEDWYLKSLAINEKQGDEHGAAITYHQLGSIAEQQRDFDRAEVWYLRSLAIKEKQGNEHGAANTYHQLGRIAEERRNFVEGAGFFLRALPVFAATDPHNAQIAIGNLARLLTTCPPEAAETVRAMGREALGAEEMQAIEEGAAEIQAEGDGEGVM